MLDDLIPIHALLTENALADEFVSSFRARRLAEKFFYWFPLSVRAWLALCSDGAYRNYVRSRSLIAQSADGLARYIPPDLVEVLSLGAGQGDKDLLLLEALRRHGARVSYAPVDTSMALLEMACAGALGARFPVQGIKADVTRADHLAALAAEPETPPRLVLLLGNTLGAFDPIAAAQQLRRLLRPTDLLLVDGEIYGERTVAGYDNPLNRRFAWAPLHAVGIREGDGELRFEDAVDPRLPGLRLVPKHFLARREVDALIGGETLPLKAGERLDMNHSYKYAADTFVRILTDAGFTVRWRGTSVDERFTMVLAGGA
ncbi:MAG: L-histidine N(alpha)-methyltransferase [Gemmatimonadales bacterium]